MYTAQTLFDACTRHILTQGRPAIDEMTGICQYRMPDGRRCAIGGLIPDHAYRQEFEGRVCTCKDIEIPDVPGDSATPARAREHLKFTHPIMDAAGIPFDLAALAARIQTAHDNSARMSSTPGPVETQMFLDAFRLHMITIAQAFALDDRSVRDTAPTIPSGVSSGPGAADSLS